jgi:hypothetical protein
MRRSSLRSGTAISANPSLTSSKKNPRSTPRRSRTYDTRPKEPVGFSLAFGQRAVFDWYEKYQYKDDAGDIFSPKWQCRLTDWRNEFDPDSKNVHDRVAQQERQPEELELGLFFLAHPVAAFSLWHVLQACYELDKRICEAPTPEKNEVADWQNWRPLQYLLSTHIMSTWENNLVLFSSEVEGSTNRFQRETVASRLYAMAEGVHVLEEALSILASVFKRQRTEMLCSYWMLDLISKGVDNRCRAIEKHITPYKAAY